MRVAVYVAAIALFAALANADGTTWKRRDSGDSKRFFLNVPAWKIGNSRRIDGPAFHTRRLDDTDGQHDKSAVYQMDIFGQNVVVDLSLNHKLFHPNYQEIRVDGNGQRQTQPGRVENCYYHGSIRNTTGSSLVAVDTCSGGLRGMIKFGEETYQIVPADTHLVTTTTEEGVVPHIIYRSSDMLANGRDGVAGVAAWPGLRIESEMRKLQKLEKSTQTPSETGERRLAGKTAHYLEWGLVNDDLMYNNFGANTEKHTASMVNAVAAIYSEKRANFAGHIIVVTLKAQLTFTTKAAFNAKIDTLSTDRCADKPWGYAFCAEKILENFNNWRNAEFNENDNAHLITGVDFDGNTVGLAGLGAMCGSQSSGINQYTNDMDTISTMAHELGHNFGMHHDSGTEKTITGKSFDASQCPESCFIMAAISDPNVKCDNPGVLATADVWTACSKHYVESYLTDSAPQCLTNVVDTGAASCGNGLVETGEDCDAGASSSSCCTSECKWATGAECDADDECCDASCRFTAANTECRASVDSDCDIAEKCSGSTAACPADGYVFDGASCPTDDSAMCAHGRCVSSTAICGGVTKTVADKAGEYGYENAPGMTHAPYLTTDCQEGSCSYRRGQQGSKTLVAQPFGGGAGQELVVAAAAGNLAKTGYTNGFDGIFCGKGSDNSKKFCKAGSCATPAPTPPLCGNKKIESGE
jgi:hypothetical protein